MSISFTKKECVWIIISILIMSFIIGFSEKPNLSPILLLYSSVIILTSVLTKKIASGFYNITIEHTIWSFRQWWWAKRDYFNKPVPIGLILPFFFSIMSLGLIKPFTFLQFDAKNNIKTRVLRKRGEDRRYEINETDLAYTSAWGLWALIALATIASFLKQPEITKYAIYYGIWNLIPVSQLDGTKIFFGSLFNWLLLLVAYVIGVIVVLI
ncbi:MAG: hypothetical protein AABW67_03200 [Nanoarchaeota archaeon]